MSQRLALLIGSGTYDDPGLKPLSAPCRDVGALAALLRDPEIGGFDEVQELVDEPEARVRRALSAFFRRGKHEDLLLIYFSGHGLRDKWGRLYWAARDTEREDLSATGVPASFVSEQMDMSPSRRQVLVLDCCFGGAFVEGGKGDDRVLTQATFEGNGYGRVVMTASDSTQFAYEGDQVIERTQLSLFTHFLIEGLSSGAAAKSGAGVITLNDWYDYAYERVVAESRRQTPCKWVYKQKGELVIARNPRPTPPPQKEIPAELLESLGDPRTWVRHGAVQEIGGLLRSDAAFSDAAARALRPLAEDDSLRVRKEVASVLETDKVDTTPAGRSDRAPAVIPAAATPAKPAVEIASRPVPPVQDAAEPLRTLDTTFSGTQHVVLPRNESAPLVATVSGEAAGPREPPFQSSHALTRRPPAVFQLHEAVTRGVDDEGFVRIGAAAVAAFIAGSIAVVPVLGSYNESIVAPILAWTVVISTLIYGLGVHVAQPLWRKLALWGVSYALGTIVVGVVAEVLAKHNFVRTLTPEDWWMLVTGIAAILALKLLKSPELPDSVSRGVFSVVIATAFAFFAALLYARAFLVSIDLARMPGAHRALGYVTHTLLSNVQSLVQVALALGLGCGLGIGLCEYFGWKMAADPSPTPERGSS